LFYILALETCANVLLISLIDVSKWGIGGEVVYKRERKGRRGKGECSVVIDWED
jgi:hypothetical protein